jgi:DNA-directed RNA polymerase
MDIKDALMRDAELFSPLAWPMLIPPNDWSNEQPGGYLLNEVMRGHDLVRRGHPVRIQGEKPLEFLNRIQKVSYCLNHFIVGVAEELDKREQPVGKFLPIVHHPQPPKPVDIEENKQSRQAYKRDSTEVRNRQAYEFRKSCRTRMTLEAVNRFKDREKFYIPWSFDYRGRAYPIPAFLTPQDTDFGKSLLRSYEEAPMTRDAEDWLAFQVATCAGLDKATMEDRLKWPGNNLTFIKRVVLDPIGTVNEWGELDEPWQFLAACEEYYRCVVTKERKTTGLFVATDATCSG